MDYFLKITKQKNHTYLAIYESFYSHNKKGTTHKSLGSLKSCIEKGIDNPITYYNEEVKKLNNVRKKFSLAIFHLLNTLVTFH